MINFGYNINKSSRIDLDKDLNIAKKIVKIEPSFRTCIGCGCCTSTCSANNFTVFNLRKIQLQINRGELQSIRKEVEKCMLCGKCQMICPRGINTRNIILAIFKVID
ncbi:MAG: 4Fe-4S dicluster domain-containing protein [Prevotellaceae bacterium]|jgi:heterodisulfide reductase subunit C|nr:4Fe-4S dicluster domain-containing protein [Prevotellaceae bacterium]